MTITRYYRVAVNLPQISESYDYHLPEDQTHPILERGALVLVPFGSQIVQGVVLEEVAHPSVAETRPIQEILDEKTVIPAHLLSLAQQMCQVTLSNLGEWMGLLLPSGLEQKSEWLYQWQGGESDFALSPLQKRARQGQYRIHL